MIKYLTAGESHGPELTGIIEGIPAGFEIRKDQIDKILTKRQLKTGAGGRMNVEKDEVLITAGIVNGLTTGGPIAITIRATIRTVKQENHHLRQISLKQMAITKKEPTIKTPERWFQ